MPEQYEQLMLGVQVRPKTEVSWFRTHEIERSKLFGRKIVSIYVVPVTQASIDTDKIQEMYDPDLRYALRFAAAVDAVGWVSEDGDCASYKDMVLIDATDEGKSSRFVRAIYSGTVDKQGHDSFMDGIYQAAPSPHENH